MTKNNRKIILDKSFLQAEDKRCLRLHALHQCGYTFILTDTLIYEFCTGKRNTLWIEAQHKLFEFADDIEVWRHTSELLSAEIKTQSPITSPIDNDITAITRCWFRSRKEYIPDNLKSIIESYHNEREFDSVTKLITLCRTFCNIHSDLYHQIRIDISHGMKLKPQMSNFINDPQILDRWIQLAHGHPKTCDLYIVGAENGLGPQWFAYHHSRSCLALWCIFMLKYGPNDNPGKDFCNTILDADYATLLHYADRLATNESSGSLADLCSWLYLDSNKLISISDVDDFLMNKGLQNQGLNAS